MNLKQLITGTILCVSFSMHSLAQDNVSCQDEWLITSDTVEKKFGMSGGAYLAQSEHFITGENGNLIMARLIIAPPWSMGDFYYDDDNESVSNLLVSYGDSLHHDWHKVFDWQIEALIEDGSDFWVVNTIRNGDREGMEINGQLINPDYDRGIYMSRFGDDGDLLDTLTIAGVADESKGGASSARNTFVKDDEGNFYFYASFRGEVQLLDTLIQKPPDSNYGVIAKMDQNFNLTWLETIPAEHGFVAGWLEVDESGDVLFSGSYQGEADLQGTKLPHYSDYRPDIQNFIFGKLTAEGTKNWVIHAGNFLGTHAEKFVLDKNDNAYISGESGTPIDFGNEIKLDHPGGGDKSFILKVNNDGNPIWIQPFLNNAKSENYDIEWLQQDSILGVAGSFNESLQIGEEQWEVEPRGEDVLNGYFALLNPAGDLLEKHQFKGTFSLISNILTFENSDEIWLNGVYGDKVNFLGQNAEGGNGEFIMKTCFDKFFASINSLTGPAHFDNEINIYPNPASTQINVDIDKAFQGESTVKLRNLAGQVIRKKNYLQNENISLNIGDLNPGTYIIEVLNESGYSTKKMIIK